MTESVFQLKGSPDVNNHDKKDDSPDLRSVLVAPWWEIVAVIAVMLGAGIIHGTYYGLTHPAEAFYRVISDRFFLVDSAFESLFLAGFLAYLHRRGWKSDDLRIRIGWMTSIGGAALFVLTYVSIVILGATSFFIVKALDTTSYAHWIYLFVPHQLAIPMGSIHLSWVLIIGFTILNAFYEELVYMGYGFNLWAKKYGPQTAVLFTVLARLAVHTYQGSEHVLQIGLWSLIFGLWYAYQRKLWPLIVAHMLTDLLSLGMLKTVYGTH